MCQVASVSFDVDWPLFIPTPIPLLHLLKAPPFKVHPSSSSSSSSFSSFTLHCSFQSYIAIFMQETKMGILPFGFLLLGFVSSVHGYGYGGWNNAHATFYGGSDASGTMGKPRVTKIKQLLLVTDTQVLFL